MTYKKLPAERAGITREVEIAGKEVRLSTGEYKDGSLGEFELKVGKPGSEERIYDVIATFGSLALQHGVPVEKIVKHMMYIDTESGGVVKGCDFRICKSIVDWVGKRLKKDYMQGGGNGMF